MSDFNNKLHTLNVTVSQDLSLPHLSFVDMVTLSRYAFPDPCHADPDGIGLIAMGGDLSASTLIAAYSQGLFPWFNDDEPIAWWCPDPRCILEPHLFTPSKSLRKQVKKSDWTWTVNQAFTDVIEACRLPRAYANDTWITEDMASAYIELHELGFAHSIEVWHDQKLIGGLYGIKLGQLFCGESMFHRESNASKMAFWALTHLCQSTGVKWIDCQLPNPHLYSLGAIEISRLEFLHKISTLVNQPNILWSPSSPEFVPNLLHP